MAGATGSSVTAYLLQLRYWIAGLILVSLFSTGGLLLVRASGGRVARSLDIGQAIAATLVLIFAANLARACWKTRHIFLKWLLPAAVVVLLVTLISRQAANNDVRAAIWSLVMIVEFLAALWLFRPENVPSVRWRFAEGTAVPTVAPMKQGLASRPTVSPLEVSATPANEADDSAAPAKDSKARFADKTEAEPNAEPVDESLVTQQMTRSMTADGGETIAGRVRVDFGAGEKQSAAHLAFTPPLQNIPEVYVDQSSGPAASVTPGSVYAHGVRVDVRLEQAADEPTSIWFEIYVVAPSGKNQD